MITQLNLENYGKFKNSSYDFGPFTVIYGRNEAGKTTMFDALFEAACATAPRRGQVWARLALRYGDERKVRVSGSVPVFKDAVEFLELFAIRAGQISVDAENGGSWAEAAKKSLYRHGYNPAEVAEKLEKRASTSNATRHQKNRNRLNSDLAETREKIMQLRSQEAAVTAAKAGLQTIEAEIAGLEDKKAVLAGDIAASRLRLENYRKVRVLQQTLRDRDFVAAAIQDENKLAQLGAYKPEAINEYDLLLKKIEDAGRGIAEIGGTINAARDTIKKLETERGALAQSGGAARQAASAAQRLLPEISRIAGLKQGGFSAQRYAIWLFGAGGVLLGLYLARQSYLGYVVSALCAAAAFAADRLLFRAGNQSSALVSERALLAGVYDQWVNLGFERSAIERETSLGVLEALMNIKSMALTLDRAVENNLKDSLAAGAALKDLESKCLALTAQRDASLQAAGQWLARAGCASRDEYLHRADMQKNLAGEAKAKTDRIKELLALESCSGPAALLSLLDGRVKELEGDGVRTRPDYERDITAEENKLGDLAAGDRRLDEELNGRKLEKESLTVTFNKDLAMVPEALNALCRKEYDLEQAIAAEELIRAGCEMAAKVYREIAAASSRKFTGLAREVEGLLVRVLPMAGLKIESLELDGVAMQDAGGVERALANLSSGTRDCFMLAARLTLAAAARGKEPGLLLLDDPLSALDAPRRAAALGLLRHFQLETGWQVIIFTKDAELLAAVDKDPLVTCCRLA